jgi:hypothetical protein
MARQVLILINIALGTAASIFIYLMLPYAGEKHPLPNCQPITATELFLFAAIPLVLVCLIVFLGVRLFPKQRMFSIVLFSAVPLMAILLGAYIFVSSTIQP